MKACPSLLRKCLNNKRPLHTEEIENDRQHAIFHVIRQTHCEYGIATPVAGKRISALSQTLVIRKYDAFEEARNLM